MVAPLIQQSRRRAGTAAVSTIAKRRFITKTEPSQRTQQAAFEAELEEGRIDAQETSRLALQAKLERERVAESKRQFDVSAGQRRRERKAQEKSFVEKIFGK